MIKLLKRYITPEFIRFVLVAILNTLFGYGVYSILLLLGMHYSLAILCSTVLGVLFNFKTYGILVFKNSSNKLIFRFILVYCVVYLFNTGGIALLKNFGISDYIAGALMLVPVGLLGFVLNKIFVYSKKR